MLKLVKYDFRRDRDKFLAVFVITVILQFVIGFTINSDQDMFMMNIITYVVAGVVLLFLTLRTFNQNLSLYNRRLVPIPVLYMALSPLLLFLGLLLGLFIVAYIQLGVYIMMFSTSFLPVNFWSVSTYAVLIIFWTSAFTMLLVMFSITVARSVRVKGRVWIGLAAFFVIQYIISFLETWMFDHKNIPLESAFRFEVTDGAANLNEIEISQYFLGLLPILFEATIDVILLFVIIKLITRRVEL
ncbi:hypothetical protein MHH52_12355 [Paenibacillus sp. FSL K6-0276]|uniref:hypothetical protein n=1 Tax=unclassified Paenibacillus TaxID=185978 RepID=UPI0028AF3640|nr:hypothetical protein [Paenibacillus sp.]